MASCGIPRWFHVFFFRTRDQLEPGMPTALGYVRALQWHDKPGHRSSGRTSPSTERARHPTSLRVLVTTLTSARSRKTQTPSVDVYNEPAAPMGLSADFVGARAPAGVSSDATFRDGRSDAGRRSFYDSLSVSLGPTSIHRWISMSERAATPVSVDGTISVDGPYDASTGSRADGTKIISRPLSARGVSRLRYQLSRRIRTGSLVRERRSLIRTDRIVSTGRHAYFAAVSTDGRELFHDRRTAGCRRTPMGNGCL